MERSKRLAIATRIRSAEDFLDRIPDAPVGGGGILCRILDQGAIPTSTGKFFAAQPVLLSGTESEGSAGTLVDNGPVIYPVIMGLRVPSAGDLVVAKWTRYRWAGQLRFTGCVNWTLTVNDFCQGSPIAGATVTVDGTPYTTDAAGKVTIGSVAKGASVTISKAGYADATTTVPSDCSGLTVSLKPIDGHFCFADLGCFDAYPSTVSLTWRLDGSLGIPYPTPNCLCADATTFTWTATIPFSVAGSNGCSVAYQYDWSCFCADVGTVYYRAYVSFGSSGFPAGAKCFVQILYNQGDPTFPPLTTAILESVTMPNAHSSGTVACPINLSYVYDDGTLTHRLTVTG